MRAFYQNTEAVAYILTRAAKSKTILEEKFRVVEKTLNSKFFLKSSTVIDPVIASQLENYY